MEDILDKEEEKQDCSHVMRLATKDSNSLESSVKNTDIQEINTNVFEAVAVLTQISFQTGNKLFSVRYKTQDFCHRI